MSPSQVDDAWLRIERWLAANAPDTHATLRAGAGAAAVADAQRRLGLRFPDDLVASLQRHDGCEWVRGNFTLAGPFRPAVVADMVKSHLETEVVLAEFEGYWDRHHLEFAVTNTDWRLVVDCEPGSSHGRVGTWHGGGGVTWSEWPSIGALLSDVADAIETGRRINYWVPVAFGRELDWKLVTAPAAAEPRSVLAMAAATTAPVARLVRQGPGQTDQGWIDEYHSSSCLTFVEGIEPDELLRRFGVGGPDVPVRRETTPLTADQARAAEHSWTTGHLPVVRVGRAGKWSFAFEDGHYEGIRPPVLPRLSAATRAAAIYFWPPELVVMEDGVVTAAFCGFDPERRGGQDPAMLDGPLIREGIRPWDRFRSLQEQISGLLAILRSELGVEFDPTVLTGALPGGPFLADLPDRALITRGLSLDHGGQVAALTEFAAPDRLRSALVIQAREVAAETGLTGYPEITDALDRLAAGETWPVSSESPLGLRFRLLAAENTAAGWATPWDNPSQELTQADRDAWKYRFRAAEAIMELIAGPPKRAARFVLGERKDPGWPRRFAADLGPVDIPDGAAAATAEREGQEHNRAHGSGGAGYRVPIWPSRSTSWTA
ncbi:MAG TPA: SMI1/KNR4 family protein [Streptosporangiaceae bacterium]|nr:SMI1/KNR4 family protein [Streptosporangiaceae bacterium]